MRKYLNILLFTPAFVLLSCTNEGGKFEGNWKFSRGNSIERILTLTSDSIIFYEVTKLVCDTFVYPDISFRISNRIVSSNELRIEIDALQEKQELRFSLKSDSTGQLCVDNECGSLRRTEKNLSVKKSKQDILIDGWKYEIAEEIVESEKHFDKIHSREALSVNATRILNFLDSTRSNLLLRFGVDYDKVSCWHKLDSLLSYQYATEILVGQADSPIDTRYSGRSVRIELITYLNEIDDTTGVSFVFPEFLEDGSTVIDYRGTKQWWESAKFYNRPLGVIIIELNSLKLKIAQLELMRKIKNTTR